MNVKHKAFKFRLYPNKEQQILLNKTFGCVRFVYNHYLDLKNRLYQEEKKSLSYSASCKDLTTFKKENTFLKEVDSVALQQCLKDLNTAFQNFFRDPKQVGFPRFKSKKRSRNSYRTEVTNNNLRLEGRKLILPKVGPVKIKQHREIPEDYVLKSSTISRSLSGKYYASLLYEYTDEVYSVDKEKVTTEQILGLDYSMTELYVSHQGITPDYPKYYHNALKRLACAQRKLSHMVKGSSNYEKQRIKVARIHEKIAFQRQDFIHNETKRLADTYSVICIEDLDMKELSKERKDEKTSIKHQHGKAVADNAWGMFKNILKYKLEERGKYLITIDKYFPSSQLCHICGYREPALKDIRIRKWICPECKTIHDRDINAALNIREEGIRLLFA